MLISFILFVLLIMQQQQVNNVAGVIGNNNLTSNDHSNNVFPKGVTLDQYLKTRSQDLDEKDFNTKDQKYFDSIMGDLVVEPTQPNKLITFEIQQTDQDNYQESRQQTLKYQDKSLILDIVPSKSKLKISNDRHSVILKPLQITKQLVPIHRSLGKPNPKSKHFSSSPHKNYSPPKPHLEMFRSLYGVDYKYPKKTIDQQMLHNTLYSKSIFPNLKKDQKYFHNKNKKQYKEILHYETMLMSKYGIKFISESPVTPIINNFRVQGIKDKYYERKRISSNAHHNNNFAQL